MKHVERRKFRPIVRTEWARLRSPIKNLRRQGYAPDSIMNECVFAWLLLCSSLSPASAVQLNVDDSVLESGRYGNDVVLLSVAYVQQAILFTDHSKVLQRIAFVETQFGSNRETFNEGMNGGIWAVSEGAFTSTQIGSHPLLVRKCEQIMLIFGIKWKAVQWIELSKPLYSALAAQLVLFTAPKSIPSDSDIIAQAQFWRENYNADGVDQDFINASIILEGEFSIVGIILSCFCMVTNPDHINSHCL